SGRRSEPRPEKAESRLKKAAFTPRSNRALRLEKLRHAAVLRTRPAVVGGVRVHPILALRHRVGWVVVFAPVRGGTRGLWCSRRRRRRGPRTRLDQLHWRSNRPCTRSRRPAPRADVQPRQRRTLEHWQTEAPNDAWPPPNEVCEEH